MQQETVRMLLYVGSSNKDLQRLPEEVKEEFSLGLLTALQGKKHPKEKHLEGSEETVY